MRALLVAVAAAALAVGCGGAPQVPAQPSPARQSPARPEATASTPVKLTGFQACQQLRDDLARNQGVPDIPMLRRIADDVIAAPRMAADARNAVRDIDHTGGAALAVALLREDCARAGVRIPPP